MCRRRRSSSAARTVRDTGARAAAGAAARTREPASAERDAERFCVRMSREREAERQVSVWGPARARALFRAKDEKSENDALLFPTLFEDNVRRDVARGARDARAASARREDVRGTPPGPMHSMPSRESDGSVLAHRARPRRRRVPVAGRRRRGPPRTKDPNPQRVRLDAGCAGNARAGTRASRETARTVVETPMDAMVKDAIVSFT